MMQYLLTEKEYQKLIKIKEEKGYIDLKKLQEFCTLVADKMPVKISWRIDDKEKPKPWKCILTADCEWYCDECPSQELCPNEYKHWSK